MAFRYFIHLAYNGAAYGGWQVQPNAVTVQELITKGLGYMAGVHNVVGCGRTDQGVHASDFYAHFESATRFSTAELQILKAKLNRFLPHDIVIYNILAVADDAHARFSALSRSYTYVVIKDKDPFLYDRAHFHYGELNVEKMNDCSLVLLGEHDFKCFSKSRTQVNNYNCNIFSAQWTACNHVLTFKITANRFLRNMVRAIVGTMLDAGQGKITVEDFREILASGNRSKAGLSVPAKGLTLTGVTYPANIFKT